MVVEARHAQDGIQLGKSHRIEIQHLQNRNNMMPKVPLSAWTTVLELLINTDSIDVVADLFHTAQLTPRVLQ